MFDCMGKDSQNSDSKSEYSKREEDVLEFWNKNEIFKKSENKGDGQFVFYDGPPFATGLPHYGHILAGTIKDVIPRYQVMKGNKIRRKWGWDCHGLPLENEIEKELGLKGKADIIEMGVGKFNDEARSRVMRYADEWKRIVPRLGRFVDMDDDYRTMDPSFTESVWWVFKSLYDKGLIYKGFKAMHLCPRCGTTLSNFEVNQGYKDISDISVYVKFKLKEEENKYLLAWTTTPWTLPGNVALAVNPDLEYVEVLVSKDGVESIYILAKDRLANISEKLGEIKSVTESFSGRKLIGASYEPIFDYFLEENLDNKENAWKVYGAEYVTADDGTGVVHIAPAFGEDDLELSIEEKLPLIFHVGNDGKFTNKVKDFDGLLVKPKDNKKEEIDHTDTDVEIIKYLAKKGVLVHKEKLIHSYPHCWRCDTPLLNYASASWFVKVTDFRDKLVKENEKILWVPENIGKYRFGNWLSEARDWAISRARFWGAPIPVWMSKDGKETLVVGNGDELRSHLKKSKNKYFMVRHGEAKSNVEGFLDGDGNKDNHLTDNGKKQVVEVAKEIKEKNIDVIFHSPLLRAKETALIIKDELGFSGDFKEDKRLSEVKGGMLQNKTIKDYEGYFKNFLERFTKENGEETYSDIKKRLGEFIYELEEKFEGKNILVVSHESPLWLLQSVALGLNAKEAVKMKNEKEFIDNAELKELDFIPLPHDENFERDYHKPGIDELEVFGEKGDRLYRISDVFDCWFESGAMPYAEHGFIGEPMDSFNPKKGVGYPANFIAEGLDQTRGWFYSLIVLGVALFGETPYRSVVVNGTLLAEDGQKMSKRLKNYPDPMEVVAKYGADSMRYYLLSSSAVKSEDLAFSERGVQEVASKVVGRLTNVLSFLTLYKDNSNDDDLNRATESKNVLDRWILSLLYKTKETIENSLDKYEIDKATREVGDFVDDLSIWYVRRSRERLKSIEEDGIEATRTLRFVLREFSKCVAPFVPFVSDYVYQKTKTLSDKESVHLEDWPKYGAYDEELLLKMKEVRRLVSLALELRSRSGIKVRQPLKTLSLKVPELSKELTDIIKDEVNVKEVEYNINLSEDILLDTNITPELKMEGDMRDFIRIVQDERKSMNLSPSDQISISVSGGVDLEGVLNTYRTQILKSVNAKEVTIGSGALVEESKTRWNVSIEVLK